MQYINVCTCRELQPSKETLQAFKQEMLTKEAADRQKAAGVGEGFGGFGGFGDGGGGGGGGGGQPTESSAESKATDKPVMSHIPCP